jgi:hypothetical protein
VTIVNVSPDALNSCADIPDEIRRRLDAGERVALILLDAFGRAFLHRHDDHPLVRRLRVDYLDDLWPELPSLLGQARPAGSSRDAFLHVPAENVDAVIAGLTDRVEDRARVLPAAELFDAIGPRLRARLGDVAVLPAPGRQVWLRSAAANERWFRGQHGGLDPAETGTYLAEIVSE